MQTKTNYNGLFGCKLYEFQVQAPQNKAEMPFLDCVKKMCKNI